MAGRLTEPKVITDFNQKLICIPPPGFCFDDERWSLIWKRYEDKGETLIPVDLLTIFPDQAVLKKMAVDAEQSDKRISRDAHEAIEKRR